MYFFRRIKSSPLVLSLLLLLNIDYGASLHSSFCIRLPKASLDDKTYEISGEGDVKSLGIEKFPQDIWGPYLWSREIDKDKLDKLPVPPKTKDWLKHPEADLILSLYSMQGRVSGSREPLTGWFRVNLKINMKGGFQKLFKSFILFAVDEEMNPVGEFVHQIPVTEQSDCAPSDATKYMIIPCSGIGMNEPIASNVILFARNDTEADKGNIFPEKYKEYWPIVPDFKGRHSLNFYFRYSIQDSNRNSHREVIFRMVGDPDDDYKLRSGSFILKYQLSQNLLSTDAYLLLKPGAVPGAADPLPTDPEDLNCQEKVLYTSDTYGWQREWNWNWYMKEFFDIPDREFGTGGGGQSECNASNHRSTAVYSFTGCLSTNFFRGRCNSSLCARVAEPIEKRRRPVPDSTSIPIVHNEKTVSCPICDIYSLPVIKQCWPEKHERPTMFNNQKDDFLGCLELYKKEESGGKQCNKTEADAKEIEVKVIRIRRNITIYVQNKSTKIEVGKTNQTWNVDKEVVDQRGVRTYGFGTILYSVRKGHGAVMLILSMFCLPISIFASRYYKETFMETRILYARPWFQIHIQLVFWMFGLYFAGITIALVGRGLIGVSLTAAGLAHRICGWLGVIIFLFVGCTGGLRWFDEPGRTCTILAHWILGYSVYAFNFVAIITSIYIPGSPAADSDTSVKGESSRTIVDKMYVAIFLWLLYEIVMQTVMTILIHMYDRRMQVTEHRKFIPPMIGAPIPVLKENTSVDASGHGIRQIILCTYIGVAGLMTAGAVGAIIVNRPQPNIGFGPMSCTHDWSEALGRYEMRTSIHPSCKP